MNTHFFHQPAEWAPHEAVWLAWPSHAELWGDSLTQVQDEFIALCQNISDFDVKSGKSRGERLEILIHPDHAPEHTAPAQKALGHLNVRFHRIAFGDIWLRDTAPIFVQNKTGQIEPTVFQFNGWGEKYILPNDNEVALKISKITSPQRSRSFDWILEGGSIEVDGEGTALTTEQCLLNPNRNPRMTRSDLEVALRESLGIEKVLWLKTGLLNDHTDGHIDTLARFVSPTTVVTLRAKHPSDPNFKVLEEIYRDLSSMTDARGRKLKVIALPSPGEILDEEGEIMPASYSNFYIGNTTVIVPTYGSPHDAEAVQTLSKLFNNRKTVGCSARSILEGGGAFHCITQQQPTQRNGGGS